MSAQRQLSSLPRTQLDRLLGGEGLGIVIPPFVVRVRSPICVVADGIERLYSDHLLAPQDGAGFFDFHVAVEASRPWFRPLCVFALDGRQPFTPLAQGEAFALFEWGVELVRDQPLPPVDQPARSRAGKGWARRGSAGTAGCGQEHTVRGAHAPWLAPAVR